MRESKWIQMPLSFVVFDGAPGGPFIEVFSFRIDGLYFGAQKVELPDGGRVLCEGPGCWRGSA